jgi:hypothetical protein
MLTIEREPKPGPKAAALATLCVTAPEGREGPLLAHLVTSCCLLDLRSSPLAIPMHALYARSESLGTLEKKYYARLRVTLQSKLVLIFMDNTRSQLRLHRPRIPYI